MSKLLVVDDDVDLLEMTVRRLKRKGFEVVAVSNLPQARDKLANESEGLNAIICDLFLENENGINFYEEIKGKNLGIKFILATGDDAGDARIETYRADEFFFCLQKPFELNVLMEIIEKGTKP